MRDERGKQQTPTSLDAWEIQRAMDLRALPTETLHAAQLTAVEYGIREGLDPEEVKETILAPLGLEGRQVA